MGFNGPVFWPVSWIHACACASRNLAPLTWFNFMFRNAAQSITANSTCGIRDCREMFASMLVPISVVNNPIDMIEIAESTSVGYTLTCKTIFLTIGPTAIKMKHCMTRKSLPDCVLTFIWHLLCFVFFHRENSKCSSDLIYLGTEKTWICWNRFADARHCPFQGWEYEILLVFQQKLCSRWNQSRHFNQPNFV